MTDKQVTRRSYALTERLTMKIWTDGGCRGNGQDNAIGAWAYVSESGQTGCGRLESTTNNRAELQAIIEALRFAKREGHQSVCIYSDSQLSINCAAGRWKRKANKDLWAEYEQAAKGLVIAFEWVKGHSGIPENELCDTLCNKCMD